MDGYGKIYIHFFFEELAKDEEHVAILITHPSTSNICAEYFIYSASRHVRRARLTEERQDLPTPFLYFEVDNWAIIELRCTIGFDRRDWEGVRLVESVERNLKGLIEDEYAHLWPKETGQTSLPSISSFTSLYGNL